MLEKNLFQNVLKSFRVRMGDAWTQERTARELGISRTLYNGWETGKSIPTQLQLKHITVTFQLNTEEEDTLYRAAAQTPPRMSTLPFPRNPFFTGRETYLAQLYKYFRESETAKLVAAISGMGGIGKTQLALEYAHQCYEHGVYRAVFWIDDANLATTSASFKSIERKISAYLPRHTSSSRVHPATTGTAMSIVELWLQEHNNWLVVMDNVEDMRTFWLSRILNTTSTGHILITSRSQIVRNVGIAAQVRLKEFEIEEGSRFLLRRSGVVQDSEHKVPEETRIEATSLVQVLGGHALALDQAAAYIEESGISLPNYIDLYRRSRRFFLDTYGLHGIVQSSHPETVVSTITLNLRQVKFMNQRAADILYFCSLLVPEEIPEEVLHKDTGLHPDSSSFDAAIAALRRYSLIERNDTQKTYAIHRLVHDVVAESMSPELKGHWLPRVMRTMRLLCEDNPQPDSGLYEWLLDNTKAMTDADLTPDTSTEEWQFCKTWRQEHY